MTHRIDAKGDEKSTAAEKGNRGKKNTREEIIRPARIRRQSQIRHASYMAEAKKRPKQCRSSDEDCAMKESFEIELCEKEKQTMGHQPLRCPKKQRRKQCADKNGGGKIGRQSGSVFQGC